MRYPHERGAWLGVLAMMAVAASVVTSSASTSRRTVTAAGPITAERFASVLGKRVYIDTGNGQTSATGGRRLRIVTPPDVDKVDLQVTVTYESQVTPGDRGIVYPCLFDVTPKPDTRPLGSPVGIVPAPGRMLVASTGRGSWNTSSATWFLDGLTANGTPYDLDVYLSARGGDRHHHATARLQKVAVIATTFAAGTPR